MNIRDLINYIKFKEKCTQKDIATEIGISYPHLSDVLNDKYNPASTIKLLLEHYPYLNEKLSPKDEKNNGQTLNENPKEDKYLSLLENQQKMILELQEQIKAKDKLIEKFIKDKMK